MPSTTLSHTLSHLLSHTFSHPSRPCRADGGCRLGAAAARRVLPPRPKLRRPTPHGPSVTQPRRRMCNRPHQSRCRAHAPPPHMPRAHRRALRRVPTASPRQLTARRSSFWRGLRARRLHRPTARLAQQRLRQPGHPAHHRARNGRPQAHIQIGARRHKPLVALPRGAPPPLLTSLGDTWTCPPYLPW